MSIILALTLAGAAAADVRWRSINDVPGFPGWRAAVRDRVNQQARRRINHLCVIAGIDEADTAIAYVYWPERRRIEVLASTTGPALSEELFGQGPIYLDKDVIGEHGQTGLSPTSVTRGWVDRLVSRCRAIGATLTVVKKG